MSFADAQSQSCPRITINDLGSTTEFSMEGLVARGIVPQSGGHSFSTVTVRIRNFAIVCDAAGDRINTSSFVSVVVEFQCNFSSIISNLTTDTALLLAYPNFVKLAQVCLTLPISTADCERAFSTMRRIKTRLRSEMNNTTLNHCMRISIEGPKLQNFDFDSAVRTYGTDAYFSKLFASYIYNHIFCVRGVNVIYSCHGMLQS